MGSACFGEPLSAQAQTPLRPSGADKEQEPSQKGSAGAGRLGPPVSRAENASRRHHGRPSRPYLPFGTAKLADYGKPPVNPRGRTGWVLAEVRSAAQDP